MKDAILLVGRPYGVKQAIGVGIVKLMSIFGKKISNPFKDGNTNLICSEWVGRVLMKIDNNLKLDLDEVSPQDVYNILTTRYIQ